MAKRKRAKVANKFLLRFGPDTLQQIGPIVPATWLVPDALAGQLQKQGRPIPEPVCGYILLDTGAQATCISSAAAHALGLKPVSKAKGFGAGGAHVNDVVFARLLLRIKDHRGVATNIWWDKPYQAVPEMEKHLADVRHEGEPVVLVGLLGRDILRLASVMYNGKNGNVEVTFDPNALRSGAVPKRAGRRSA